MNIQGVGFSFVWTFFPPALKTNNPIQLLHQCTNTSLRKIAGSTSAPAGVTLSVLRWHEISRLWKAPRVFVRLLRDVPMLAWNKALRQRPLGLASTWKATTHHLANVQPIRKCISEVSSLQMLNCVECLGIPCSNNPCNRVAAVDCFSCKGEPS